MSGEEGSAISHRDLYRVHTRIERCLVHYLTKKQTMEALHVQDNIEPRFTELVWERLEQENPEFFKRYYLGVVATDQIQEFNRLIARQVELMNQSGLTGSTTMLPSNGSHISPIQQVPTPYAAQNARLRQGENMNIQHPSAFNNCGSSIQPCVQGTASGSRHDSNFDVSRSVVYPQNSNMGLAQGTDGNIGLAQRPNEDMGLAQRPNEDMGLAQRPNRDMGLAHRPNWNMVFAQMPNSNMGLAQRPNGNMGVAQKPDSNMGLAQSPNVNLGFAESPNVNEDMGFANWTNRNMGFSQRPNANMELAQRTHGNMGLARTMNENNVKIEGCYAGSSSFIFNQPTNILEPRALVGDACMSSPSNVEYNAQHNTLLYGDASSLGHLPQIPHCSQLDVNNYELFARCYGPSSTPIDAGDFVDPQGDF